MNTKILIILIALFLSTTQSFANKNNKEVIKIEFKGDINTPIMILKSKKNRIYYLTGDDSRYFYVDHISGKVYFRGVQKYEPKTYFNITAIAQDSLGGYASANYSIKIQLIQNVQDVNSSDDSFFIFLCIFLLPLLVLRP